MTDYYTRFAIWIPLTTEAELQWWRRAFHVHLPALWGGAYPDDKEEEKAFFAKHPEIWSNFEGESVCNLHMRDDDRFPHGLICLTDDEGCANIDGTAHFIQAYLKDFNIEKPVAFMWGEDCDQYRPDGFGGGACYVSQTEIRIESAFGIIEKWMQDDKVPLSLNYHDTTPYGVGSLADEEKEDEE